MTRREWTSTEAEKWTVEDTVTVIISPLIYLLLMIGVAMSSLMMPAGFMMVGLAIILIIIMVRVINPKLSAISEEYEKKQKEYILELEKKVKWEE